MAAQPDWRDRHGWLHRDADASAGVWGAGQYIGSTAYLYDDADRIFMQYVQGVRHIPELRFLQALVLNMCVE